MSSAVLTESPVAESSVPPRVAVDCPLCDCADSNAEREIDGYQLVRCGSCSLVFVNPRSSEEELADIYTVRDEDGLVDLYARIATDSVLRTYDEKLEYIESLVPQKGRLLDFACAAGYFFERAQKRGWDAHGADIGEWVRRAADRRGLTNMHVGPIEEQGFAPESFDVVYAAQVFEHLTDPRGTLRMLKGLLRPGGLLYIDVPNYHTLSIMANRDDFMLNTPPQHINYFTPKTLRKLLRDGGLESIRIFSGGGLKWENLLGRPIESDIAEAYGLVDCATEAGAPSLVSRAVSMGKRAAKAVVMNGFVRPVLYNGWKVGMNLDSVSRKPGPS